MSEKAKTWIGIVLSIAYISLISWLFKMDEGVPGGFLFSGMGFAIMGVWLNRMGDM